MKLSEINFPVFKLGNYKPLVEKGVTLFINLKTSSFEIVDDKNVELPTLKERRLSLLNEGVALYPIRLAIFFIGDFIKVADPKLWFIDSSGVLFKYKKETMVNVESAKITKTIKVPGAVLIEVLGLPFRLKALFPPTIEEKYASIIKYKGLNLLYGYSKIKHSTIHRKI